MPPHASLLPVVVIQRFAAEDAAFGGAHAPLPAVRIIDRFTDGIVRDDVEDEVVRAVVDELVWFVWFEEEGVAGADGRRAVLMPRGARAGDDVIELPLRTVQVERVSSFAGLDADDFHIKRVTLHQVRRVRLAAERLGDFPAGPAELALR